METVKKYVIPIIAVLAITIPAMALSNAMHTKTADYYIEAIKIKQAELDQLEYESCLFNVEQAKEQLADFYDDELDIEYEEVHSLSTTVDAGCLVPASITDSLGSGEGTGEGEATASLSPDELYYIFNRADGISSANVSQSQREHFANNGYMATDIATDGRYLVAYAPSYEWMDDEGVIHDDVKEYTVKIVENYDTMGLTVELHWDWNNVHYNFAIGHMKQIWVDDGSIVKTGEKIGSTGGCVGDLQMGEKSTGCHIHFEYRVEHNATAYPEYTNSPHGEDLEALRKHRSNDDKLAAYLQQYAADDVKPLADIFNKAGEAHKIKPEVLVCIAMADTTLGKATRTENNIGNVGNTATSSKSFDTLEDAIFAMGSTLNNQYLGSHTNIGQLSPGGGGTGKIYASSDYNWNKNVLACLTEITGQSVDETFNFRI